MTADANDATPQVLRLRQAGADAVIMRLNRTSTGR